MAKDSRTIHSSVRIGGVAYGPGMEDEVSEFLSATDVDRLTEKGAISGFSSKKGKAAKAEADAESSNDTEPGSKESGSTEGSSLTGGKPAK